MFDGQLSHYLPKHASLEYQYRSDNDSVLWRPACMYNVMLCTLARPIGACIILYRTWCTLSLSYTVIPMHCTVIEKHIWWRTRPCGTAQFAILYIILICSTWVSGSCILLYCMYCICIDIGHLISHGLYCMYCAKVVALAHCRPCEPYICNSYMPTERCLWNLDHGAWGCKVPKCLVPNLQRHRLVGI